MVIVCCWTCPVLASICRISTMCTNCTNYNSNWQEGRPVQNKCHSFALDLLSLLSFLVLNFLASLCSKFAYSGYFITVCVQPPSREQITARPSVHSARCSFLSHLSTCEIVSNIKYSSINCENLKTNETFKIIYLSSLWKSSKDARCMQDASTKHISCPSYDSKSEPLNGGGNSHHCFPGKQLLR